MGTDEARETTLTLDDLYALYRHTYWDHEIARSRSIARSSILPPVARVVAEFAESDAQNGKPIRSFSEFRLALSHGAGALGPLGWTAV